MFAARGMINGKKAESSKVGVVPLPCKISLNPRGDIGLDIVVIESIVALVVAGGTKDGRTGYGFHCLGGRDHDAPFQIQLRIRGVRDDLEPSGGFIQLFLSE